MRAKAFHNNACSLWRWVLSPLCSPRREDLQPWCPVGWLNIQTAPGLDKLFDWRDTVGSRIWQSGWSRCVECLTICLRGGETYHGICRKYALIHWSVFNTGFSAITSWLLVALKLVARDTPLSSWVRWNEAQEAGAVVQSRTSFFIQSGAALLKLFFFLWKRNCN